MGTEDRVTDPKKQIAANPTVIPFVTFPGQEIKDLIVHEVEAVVVAKDPVPVPPPRKQAVVPPKQPVPTTQPAPIVQPIAQQPQQQQQQSPQQQQQPPQRQQKVNSRPPQQQQQRESSSTSEQTTAPPVQSKVNPPVPPTHHTTTGTSYGHPQQRDATRASSGAGTGAHLLRLKERKERGSENTTTNERSSGSGEFDFTAGLSMFKKDDVFAVVATEADQSSSSEVKYKKDDFFDSLSCDLTDRKEGRNTRMSAAEERVLNQDTFGAIALHSTGNYRRNFRGGGGGGYAGRGGGRGRGRGGRGGRSYQNQYQANN